MNWQDISKHAKKFSKLSKSIKQLYLSQIEKFSPLKQSIIMYYFYELCPLRIGRKLDLNIIYLMPGSNEDLILFEITNNNEFFKQIYYYINYDSIKNILIPTRFNLFLLKTVYAHKITNEELENHAKLYCNTISEEQFPYCIASMPFDELLEEFVDIDHLKSRIISKQKDFSLIYYAHKLIKNKCRPLQITPKEYADNFYYACFVSNAKIPDIKPPNCIIALYYAFMQKNYKYMIDILFYFYEKQELPYKLPKFTISKEAVKEFIKQNQFIIKIIVPFLIKIKTMLPSNILSIFIGNENNFKNEEFDPFYKKITKIDDINIPTQNLIEKIEYFMKYRKFKQYFFENFNPLRYEKNVTKYIIEKYGKRPDYEYYLELQPDEYPTILADTFNVKGYKSDYFSLFTSKNDVSEKFLILRRELTNLLKNDLGVLFIKKYLELLIEYNQQDIIIDIVKQIHDINKPYLYDLNDAIWDNIVDIKELFIKCLNYFIKIKDMALYQILKNDNTNIKDIEIYLSYGISYPDETIEFLSSNFNIKLFIAFFKTQHTRMTKTDLRIIKKCIDKRIIIEKNYDLDYIINNKLYEKGIFYVKDDKVYRSLYKEDLLKYVNIHPEYKTRLINSIDYDNCSIEDGIILYKLGVRNVDYSKGNEIYKLSTALNLSNYFKNDPSIAALYILTKIRPQDATIYVYNSIELLLDTSDEKCEYILLSHTKNKYFLFSIIDILISRINTKKLLILKIFNQPEIDCSECNNYISNNNATLINALIPLLNDINKEVCTLSKEILYKLDLKIPEIKVMQSQLVQCLINKMYVAPFLKMMATQEFNHYLNFVSLNLLIYILLKNIEENNKLVIKIIVGLRQITYRNQYNIFIPMILRSILFREEAELCEEFLEVVEGGYFFKEKIYDIFIDNLGRAKGIKFSRLLVFMLNKCNEEEIKYVIERIMNHSKNTNGGSNKENSNNTNIGDNINDKVMSFLSYAPRLSSFNNYVNLFVPSLKSSFISNDKFYKEIATLAFEKLLWMDDVISFIIECSFNEEWSIRMVCTDLLYKALNNNMNDDIIATLFILRNDTNHLIRHKAVESFNTSVSNTPSTVKRIMKNILEKLKYDNEAVHNTIHELIDKYSQFIKFDDLNEESKEFVLFVAIQKGKFKEPAFDYAVRYNKTEIIKELIKEKKYKYKLLEYIKESNTMALYISELKDDKSFIDELYNFSKDKALIQYLSNTKKYKLLNEVDDNTSIEIIKTLPDKELQTKLIDFYPRISLLYLKNKGATIKDYGNMNMIFQRIFTDLEFEDFRCLIKKEYFKYLLNVSFKRINDYTEIIRVMGEDKEGFKRISEIIYSKVEIYDVNMLMGILLRWYLYPGMRCEVKGCIDVIRKRYNIGEYNKILKRVI
ncbi:hypothetical protein TCON_1648 [Astathelohania contejeani]|uniref:Uncharacterized protein n=1 Tax=Astathelohania contejeani TaxID=164912 RepID=A0ABQ7HYB3_9MICR|nr:hypothetical protein TCON_1648 [Thelohania contejeani]